MTRGERVNEVGQYTADEIEALKADLGLIMTNAQFLLTAVNAGPPADMIIAVRLGMIVRFAAVAAERALRDIADA